MREIVDILERRVAAALDLIGSLRDKAVALERELANAHARAAAAAPPAAADPALVEELQRLRAERAMVRERVRALIREIDRVSW